MLILIINYLFAFPYEYESTDPFASHVESGRMNDEIKDIIKVL
jgi:hypothetical protein